MAIGLDKNYRLIEFKKGQLIKRNDYTTIYTLTNQRGYLDCLVISVSDTNVSLKITIDDEDVVDSFSLKDFNSLYKLEEKGGYNIPLTSIDEKTFKYQPREFQEFNHNLTIGLKHNSSSNRKLGAGYITYQTRI